jgi:predicted dehydrogenase
MGRLHARVFSQLADDFTLVGVYDPSAATASDVARAWSVPAFASESVAIESADLVVIASPIEAHAGAGRRALARGRHVFVEKPVCDKASQAFALTRSVGRGQRLFVGHSERFNPVIRALRDRVAPSDVRTIRLQRTSATARPTRVGHEHGALMSLGVHDLDLVAYLTASPVALREVTHVDEDSADLVLTAARGAAAWVHVDRRAPKRERLIEVVTHEAIYSGDLLARTLTVQPRRGGTLTLCPVVEEEALVAQAIAIARALRGAAEDVASGVEGARALALVEQAVSRGSVGELSCERPDPARTSQAS